MMIRKMSLLLAAGLIAGAAGLSAQNTITLSFNPVQPRFDHPVTVTAKSSAPIHCYIKDPVPVRSGSTIDLNAQNCFIGTPPVPPGPLDESWDLGRLPAGTYTVRFRFDGSIVAQTQLKVLLCSPDRLCFQGGRIEVAAEWFLPGGGAGFATAEMITAETGYLWFFQPANVEVLVKLLDGCFLNGHFWFFAAGLTDVETRITVTDTLLGTTHTYTNPQGTPFAPIQATSTFGCD
jgi:hypothetical protein